jgi:hypothetical protein
MKTFNTLEIGTYFLIGSQPHIKTSAFMARPDLPCGNGKARAVNPHTEVRILIPVEA